MYEILRDHLLAQWPAFFPAEQRPASVQLLLTKGSLGDAGGRVTFFVFINDEPAPRAVVKIARDPRENRLIDREHDALRYVHAHAPRTAAARAPRALHRGDLGGYAFILQDAMNGSSAATLLTERLCRNIGRAYDIITSAANWLAELQSEIAGRQAPPPLSAADLTGLIADYTERYHPAGGTPEADLLKTLADAIPGIAAQKYPMLYQHGDLSAINLVILGHDLAVIDWEDAAPAGLPFYDMFFLLTFFEFGPSAGAEGNVRIQTYNDAFTRAGRHADFTASLITKYAAACGCSTAHITELYGFFLLSRAVREHDVLAAQAHRGYVPVVKPYGAAARFSDGSLFRDNVYAALLHEYTLTSQRFISATAPQ